MKIIRFIRPKRDIADVPRCDSCGSKNIGYYSIDHARYLCGQCKETVDAGLKKAGIDTKGYWKRFVPLVQTVPESEIKHKPFRPRKKRSM